MILFICNLTLDHIYSGILHENNAENLVFVLISSSFAQLISLFSSHFKLITIANILIEMRKVQRIQFNKCKFLIFYQTLVQSFRSEYKM